MQHYTNARIFDVFLSSTFRDLEPFRAAAIKAIRAAGHREIAMESFGAQAGDMESTLADNIKRSDIVIAAVGQRAGSRPRDRSVSEMEYDWALEYGKPILRFVPNDHDVDRYTFPKTVKQFRDRMLKSGEMVYQYSLEDIDDFRREVGASLDRLARELEAKDEGGWIRSDILDKYVSRDLIPAPILSSSSTRDLVYPLFNMMGLQPNMDQNVPLKFEASRLFLKSISVALNASHGIRRIFIDGGSSTYQFCRALNAYLTGNSPYFHSTAPRTLVVATNSIINFIELSTNIKSTMRPYRSLRMYPAPPISSDYGKTFGYLSNIEPEIPYTYEARNWKLRPETRSKLDDAVKEYVRWLEHGRCKSLSIISAAGIYFGDNWSGPWVKHHASMLLQQGVFRAGQPLLLLLDDSKWGSAPPPQEAYRVLFDDLCWNDVLTTQPVAIAVCASTEERVLEIEAYAAQNNLEVIPATVKQPFGKGPIYPRLLFNKFFKPLVAPPAVEEEDE